MESNKMIIIGVVAVFAVLIGGLLIFSSASPWRSDEPQRSVFATIQTTKGDIDVELFIDRAPNTVGNFAALALSGFYEGIKVHRVVDDFVVQMGDPLTKTLPLDNPRIGTGGSERVIPDEFHPELSNVRGTLAMANSGPESATSQFFINLADNTFLDYNKPPETSQHAVFGRVRKGMNVVESLERGDSILSITIRE